MILRRGTLAQAIGPMLERSAGRKRLPVVGNRPVRRIAGENRVGASRVLLDYLAELFKFLVQ